jgi:hypothetical protein
MITISVINMSTDIVQRVTSELGYFYETNKRQADVMIDDNGKKSYYAASSTNISLSSLPTIRGFYFLDNRIKFFSKKYGVMQAGTTTKEYKVDRHEKNLVVNRKGKTKALRYKEK